MSEFLRYITELTKEWLSLVTGSILAVLLFLISIPTDFFTRTEIIILDIVILLIAIIIATYKVWRKQEATVSNLRNSISAEQDATPKHIIKLLPTHKFYSNILSQVDNKIQEARKMIEPEVPDRFGLSALSKLVSVFPEPTNSDWEKYIRELQKYGTSIRSYADNKITLNLRLMNTGRQSDTSLNVKLTFKNLEFLPNFYEKEISQSRPTEPNRNFTWSLLADADFEPASRTGIHLDILDINEKELEFEVNRLHAGESVDLNRPLFFNKITEDSCISYTIKSNATKKPITGTIHLKDVIDIAKVIEE